MKRIYAILSLMLVVSGAWAQSTPNMYKYTTGTLYTAGPFLGSGYYGYHNQFIIRASDMTGKQGGNITKLFLRAGNTGSTSFTGLEIRMAQTTQADYGNYTGSTVNFVTSGLQLVFSGNLTISHTSGQWVEIALQNPFTGYSGTGNIVIDTYVPSSNPITGTGLNLQGSYYTLNSNLCQEMYWYGTPASSTTGYQYVYYKDAGFFVASSNPTQPVASFYAQGTICNGSPTPLINTSILNGWNIVTQWTITPNTYSFVNGTTSASKSPTVSFNTAGNYTVKLKVANNIGADSIVKVITVGSPTAAPVADFYTDRRIVGSAQTFVNTIDLSTNCPQSWLWTSPDYAAETPFGNPFVATATSTMQNAKAFFVTPGQWDICLQATNTIGSNSTCKTNYITVLPIGMLCTDTISTASQGYVTDEGGVGNTYGNSRTLSNCKGFLIDPCAATVTLNFEAFKLNTGGGDSVFVHDGPNQFAPRIFAGGANLNGQTINPVTANSGKMFVYMITNASGVDDGFIARWSSTTGTYGKPTASFSFPTPKGFAKDTFYSGYAINMINASTGVDVKYQWDLNGDNVVDSFNASPKAMLYNYTSNPVQYNITLIAWNCKGYDTLVKVVTIMPITNKPTPVNFVASRLNVAPGDTVRLTDLTIGATNWTWTFTPNVATYLNGTNKNSENPVVFINTSGCVTVKLVASNGVGSDSLTKNCYITGIIYCAPGVATILNTDVGISKVQLGSINNSSVAGTYAYENYADSSFGSTNLYKGLPYTVTVSRPTNVDPCTIKAWIDFNFDGDFLDAGETIGSQVGVTSTSASFNFVVPNSALYGISRMRIGTSYGSNFLDPCATFMGEFEDYRIYLLKDTIRPVITLLGSDTVYIEMNQSYTDAGATAFDNLEGNITPKMTSTTDLNITKVGYYSQCYAVSDIYGNQAITKCRVIGVKVDLTPPSLTLLGKNPDTISVYSSYTDPGYVAIDNYSGNLTAQVVKVSTVDTAHVGMYLTTYSVADYFGFSTTKTRVTYVVDNQKPVITPTATTYTHSVHMPLNDNMVASVTDNYYTNVTLVRTGSVNVDVLGTYSVTYNAVDGSGNAATAVNVTIIVADTTKPVINLHSSDTVKLEVFSTNNVPAITVTDNYDAANKISVSSSGSVNMNVLGCYPVVYTATDSSNNTAVKTRVVCVVDTQGPQLTLKGGNLVNWSLGKPWVDPGVKILDNYDKETDLNHAPYLTTTGVPNTSLAGIYWITYSVVDKSGNPSNTETRQVNVLVTGVEDALADNIHVYPNPTSGIVKLDLKALNGSHATVDVLNVMGQSVYTTVTSENELSLNLSNLAQGNYTVKITSGDSNIRKKLIIVK